MRNLCIKRCIKNLCIANRGDHTRKGYCAKEHKESYFEEISWSTCMISVSFGWKLVTNHQCALLICPAQLYGTSTVQHSHCKWTLSLYQAFIENDTDQASILPYAVIGHFITVGSFTLKKKKNLTYTGFPYGFYLAIQWIFVVWMGGSLSDRTWAGFGRLGRVGGQIPLTNSQVQSDVFRRIGLLRLMCAIAALF